MIRPLEALINKRNKRARFSFTNNSSANSKNSFKQMLNLNNINNNDDQFQQDLNEPSVQVIQNGKSVDHCDTSTVNLNEVVKNNNAEMNDRNNKRPSEDDAESQNPVESNVQSTLDKYANENNENVAFYFKNTKSSCNLSCSDAVYCSSPHHRNGFYEFKSIKEQCDDDLNCSPPRSADENNLKVNDQSEIMGSPRTPFCILNPENSSNSYKPSISATDRPKMPRLSFYSTSSAYISSRRYIDISPCPDSCPKCDTSKNRPPSKKCGADQACCANQPDDVKNNSAFFEDVAKSRSKRENYDVRELQYEKSLHSEPDYPIKEPTAADDVNEDPTNNYDDVNDDNYSSDSISEAESDDSDFSSNFENDNELCFDYDGNLSRISASTSTDIFTPALSFGTSSSAALTEGLDSLSIQSSSEVDLLSNGCSFASNSDLDFDVKCNLPLRLPLRPSLFTGIPPTIYFSVEGESVMPLPSEIRHQLRWKLSTITPLIMKKTVTRAGISLTKSTTDWCGTWGKQVKVVNFKAIKSYQKVNHFPWTFQIGRKDKLWKNVRRMKLKHGHSHFHFLPQTYILPHDIKALKRAWDNLNQKKPRVRHKWIIKPPASARGQGIRVIHKWSQIPKKWPIIVQRYLSNPYLINGSKFDLRLYVLVTSFDPLKIYVFDDGLVRFASVKYSSNVKSLNDKFMHLTNYSINKKSSSYTANEDINACQGHKWSLKSLWKYMHREGINTKALWNNIIDIIIKTIISCESSVTNMLKRYVRSSYNCYELFGFDVMLDEKLKPWLLEVNISPSLHSNSPLDACIKGQLAKDLLNLAGFHIPNRLSESTKNAILSKFGFCSSKTPLCHDKKLYNHILSAEEKAKMLQYQQIYNTVGTTQVSILDDLTAGDMKHLILSEDELSRAGQFVRVYPSAESHKYHKYFENFRYYDILLDAWEISYYKNRAEGVQKLQRLYRNHVDGEKKAETKITCKSTTKTAKKIISKKVIRNSRTTCPNRRRAKMAKQILAKIKIVE